MCLATFRVRARLKSPHSYHWMDHQTVSVFYKNHTVLWLKENYFPVFLFSQGHGKIEVPLTAQPGVIPSIYTGHPSYAYPADKSYAEDRGYPGTVGFPAKVEGPSHYPGGAPALGNHSGAPAPTGFPRLDSRGFVYWPSGPCDCFGDHPSVDSSQELDVSSLLAFKFQDVALTHCCCHVTFYAQTCSHHLCLILLSAALVMSLFFQSAQTLSDPLQLQPP